MQSDISQNTPDNNYTIILTRFCELVRLKKTKSFNKLKKVQVAILIFTSTRNNSLNEAEGLVYVYNFEIVLWINHCCTYKLQ